MGSQCLQILLGHVLAAEMGQPSESPQVNWPAMLHHHALVLYRLLKASSSSLSTGLEGARWLILNLLRVECVDVSVRIRHNAKLAKVVGIDLQVVPLDILREESAEVNTQGHQCLLQLAGLQTGNGFQALVFGFLSALQVADADDVVQIFDLILSLTRAFEQVKSVVGQHLVSDLRQVGLVLEE